VVARRQDMRSVLTPVRVSVDRGVSDRTTASSSRRARAG
jgi:hypothetical protein